MTTPFHYTFHDSHESSITPLRHRASTISCTSSTSSFAPSMTSSFNSTTACPSPRGHASSKSLSSLSLLNKCVTPSTGPSVPTTFHENILGYMLKSHDMSRRGTVDDGHVRQAEELVRGTGTGATAGAGESGNHLGCTHPRSHYSTREEYFFGDVDKEGEMEGLDILSDTKTKAKSFHQTVFPTHSSSHFRSHFARTRSLVFFEPGEENTNSYHPSHPRLLHRSSLSTLSSAATSPSPTPSTASSVSSNNTRSDTASPVTPSYELDYELSSHFSSCSSSSSSSSSHSSFSSSSTHEETFHSLITSRSGQEFSKRRSAEKFKLRAAVKAWERSLEVGVGEKMREAFSELKGRGWSGIC